MSEQEKSNITTAVRPDLVQGSLVRFGIRTDRIGRELAPSDLKTNSHLGIVMSSNDFNHTNENGVVVCPILAAGEDPNNSDFGIEHQIGSKTYILRPDLNRVVPFSAISKPLAGGESKQAIVLPENVVSLANVRLLNRITPTRRSMATAGPNGLKQGTICWFNGVPHNQDMTTAANAPVIILSSAEMMSKTGLALTARSFTNIARFDRINNSPVILSGKASFITCTVNPLSLTRMSMRSIDRPQAPLEFVEECVDKIARTFSIAAAKTVFKKYVNAIHYPSSLLALTTDGRIHFPKPVPNPTP